MMQSLFFIVSIYYFGYLASSIFISKSKIPRFSVAFLFGSIFACSFIFATNFIIHSLILSIIIYFLLFIIIVIVSFKKIIRGAVLSKIVNRRNILWILFTSVIFIFFERTFNYDSLSSIFSIQSNLFQDFGAHISFIRYFSSGENYLPEVPFFAGKNLLYHFMFDFYASIFEYLGLRIDYAFNLISALSLAHLVNLLIGFSYLVFKSRMVGYISAAFVFFSTDLSFINLLDKYGFSFTSWYHHNEYIVGKLFGIEMGKNFLNINTYINQRHLIFALLFFIIFTFLIYENRHKRIGNKAKVILVLLLGLFPFWHITGLISSYIFLVSSSLLFKKIRRDIILVIIVSLVVVLPQLFIIKSSSVNEILFNPGFLMASKLSIGSFVTFWIWNLGLLVPLVIFGLYKSDNSQRKLFLSLLPLFIIPLFFQFSRDIFDNHKFFNIWMISVAIFSAYALVRIMENGVVRKVIGFLLFLIAIVSGIAHFLVIKNDVYAKIPDYKNSELIGWIDVNIDSDEAVLTNGNIYDPVSIAGRKIFLGRAHYIYLYGGDPSERIIARELILSGNDLKDVKIILTGEGINYIILYKSSFAFNIQDTNYDFFELNFEKIYENHSGIIYKI